MLSVYGAFDAMHHMPKQLITITTNKVLIKNLYNLKWNHASKFNLYGALNSKRTVKTNKVLKKIFIIKINFLSLSSIFCFSSYIFGKFLVQ